MSPQLTVELRLRGGMANQLFQWCVADYLQRKHGGRIEFDFRGVERAGDRGDQLTDLGLTTGRAQHLRPHIREAWRVAYGCLGGRWYAHLNSLLDRRTMAVIVEDLEQAERLIRRGRRRIAMRGYFEETSLVRSERDYVRAMIRPGLERLVQRRPYSQEYSAIHVRRGDYVTNPVTCDKFGPCTLEYYRAAAAELPADLSVVICTDDRRWVERELVPCLGGRNVEILDGVSHFDDLMALASSRHIVMSNSSFSWWAAQIGDPQTVVVPVPWDREERTRYYCDPSWTYLSKLDGSSAAGLNG